MTGSPPPRHLAWLLALLLLPGCARATADEPGAPPAAVLRAVELWREEPGRRDVGELEILGAWELRGGREGFGGFSGMAFDGEHLLVASDRGWLWQARPAFAGDGTLLRLDFWQVERLRFAGAGRARDVEELLVDADGSQHVLLERVHAIAGRPAGSTGPMKAVKLPAPLDAAPSNEGIEAAARLADGSLLLLSEGQRTDDGAHRAALLKEGRARLLGYRPAAGFRPTGAARLGRWLFVVERRVSLLAGLEGRIAALDLDALPPVQGAVLEGRELARLGGRTISDNVEAIAARPGPDGAIHLFVLSDDNFSILQETLLLQLAWRP
ncbi:esterase-like activity of phytase family protein [Geminicoccaceae bacterium 1502E]|nr:esterase-like activity of phytase family protein [Geminicoccaceae bacterium 1502E]